MSEKEPLVKNEVSTSEEVDRTDQFPTDWQERAEEAARRFGIPMPSDENVGSSEQAEQRLREFEQEGGQ